MAQSEAIGRSSVRVSQRGSILVFPVSQRSPLVALMRLRLVKQDCRKSVLLIVVIEVVIIGVAIL